MTHHKPTQNERILDYIAENGSITQLEALKELGIKRYSMGAYDAG